MKEEVILVDQNDRQTGTLEKLEAHQKGLLHRAFSVFVFNSKNQLLLQQRALGKYHSAGLWTNTCCSHPRPGEAVLAAAHRRLKEEMGLETILEFKTAFVYKSAFENGLTEHEFDHIFIGYSDLAPLPDPLEVENYKYLDLVEIKQQVTKNPGEFTTWFRIAMERFF